jgi:hypothetical protein
MQQRAVLVFSLVKFRPITIKSLPETLETFPKVLLCIHQDALQSHGGIIPADIHKTHNARSVSCDRAAIKKRLNVMQQNRRFSCNLLHVHSRKRSNNSTSQVIIPLPLLLVS